MGSMAQLQGYLMNFKLDPLAAIQNTHLLSTQ